MKCGSITFLKAKIQLGDLNSFPEIKEEKHADSTYSLINNKIVRVSQTAAAGNLRVTCLKLALQRHAATDDVVPLLFLFNWKSATARCLLGTSWHRRTNRQSELLAKTSPFPIDGYRKQTASSIRFLITIKLLASV